MTSAQASTRPPLHRDVRVLSWAFQLVVFALVAGVVYWLVGNYQENTAASGIPTSFDFLSNPATFGIPGADFAPTESVRNAYVIGVLNTLRVSVVGIILATVLGILIGIGRLSKNWIVSKISAVYVEVIRNLPLLVIMTFTFLGLILQAMPTIQEAWVFSWLVVSNRGIGVPWYQNASGWALFAVFMVGLAGWWLVARWRRSVSEIGRAHV